MTVKARIFRAPKGKDRPYFSMRRETAQDTTLSWEARGMLAYFMSLQDGWEVTLDDLKQNCGRDKTYSIIKELRKARYMKRERVRKPDGTFTWSDYQVFERPYTEKPDMDTGEPLPEKPYTEKPESKTHNTSNHKDHSTAPSDDAQLPETLHGFQAGDLKWVWSEVERDHVICTITRETKAFVWFIWDEDADEHRRSPDNVYHEKPKLETFEDLTPLQQVVLKWVRDVKPGEGIPGPSKAYANTILNHLDIRFGPTHTQPTPAELDRAWAWDTKKRGETTKAPDKIPAMVNAYRKTQVNTSQMREGSTPSQAGRDILLRRKGTT